MPFTWMSGKEKQPVEILQESLDLIVLRICGTIGAHNFHGIALRLGKSRKIRCIGIRESYTRLLFGWSKTGGLLLNGKTQKAIEALRAAV